MLKSVYLKFLFSIFLVACFLPATVAQPCREVVGYYASWKWYKRNKLVNPATIDYTKYTIINYAFFKPLSDGSVIEGDAYADNVILTGNQEANNDNKVFDPSVSLVERAHQNDVRVVASVGGWTWSQVFSGIAASEQKRKKFASDCALIVKKYNLDGIDIDWEFPGSKARGGSP